ncbi:MAG: ABC transporter ATP-binding protein [Carboxydocellales bacterium]
MFVQIKDLKFKYKKAVEDTVKGFNLEIEKGEIISILGESGSGKSTVLRLIAGLETPRQGLIRIADKLMVDNNSFVQPEKRGIGMVFQDYALFPHMTVDKNVKFGLHKIEAAEKNQRLAEVLKLVNLNGFEKRYPHELSGGQQQRVALARALAPRPSLLLLDEPFSNLDRELQLKIRDELKTILQKAGMTTIFVTHDKEDSQALADRVVIMRNGEIAAIGDPRVILD